MWSGATGAKTQHPMRGCPFHMPNMTDKTYPFLSRSKIEALIAEGRKVVILDQFVIKADAWIPFHPGGDKAILHMVGRDATDEVTACVTPSYTC